MDDRIDLTLGPTVVPMIISKTPLRISFCGGGSDIPSFYSKHGGCVVSTSINKYIYITSVKSFDTTLTQLKYSVVENVHDIECIRHPVFREMLKQYGLFGYEINSTSDVPSGTGLGSSSTFAVGLSNLLNTVSGRKLSKEQLAQDACNMELCVLKEPIGKQDQYAAAYGGMNFIEFHPDESVTVEPIKLTPESKKSLNDRLMMLYLGGTRSASDILKNQSANIKSGLAESNQLKMCELARTLRSELEDGRLDAMGEILDKGWKLKRTLSSGISNPEIDEIYETVIDLGATGGKLLGAGGNGFMLFYADASVQNKIKHSIKDKKWMPFSFDEVGSRIIYNDEVVQ